MLLACEHDRATGHFSIGAPNAPSGVMTVANKLKMNTRAEIIFMIFPKKTFACRHYTAAETKAMAIDP
jgi:hypothetical protein